MNTSTQKLAFGLVSLCPAIASGVFYWYFLGSLPQGSSLGSIVGGAAMSIFAFFMFGLIPSIGITLAGIFQIIGLLKRKERIGYYVFCTLLASTPLLFAIFYYFQSN